MGAGEVEAVLLGHPGVDEVAVVAAPDEDLGERIVAFVVTSNGGSCPAEGELVATLRASSLRTSRPREVRFVDSLPRNAMGKVMKKKLEV